MTNLDLQNYLQASRNQQLLNSPAINPQQYGVFQSQPLQLGMTPEQLQAGLQQANYVPIADVPVAAALEPVAAPQPNPAAAVQEPQKMYPYDAYEAQRKKQMDTVAKGWQSASRYASMLPAGQSEAYMSGFKNYVENAFPKMPEFKDTPEAEAVKSHAAQIQKITGMSDTIYNELKDASKILDKTEKISRLQTIVPKLLQSIASGGSDAMQLGEFLIGASELTNFSTYLEEQRSKGLFNVASAAANFAARPTTRASIMGMLEADPDAYARKAMAINNSVARSINNSIERHEDVTSPEFVKKFGIGKVKLFPESDLADPYELSLKGANAPIQQAIGQGMQTMSDQERLNKYRTKK
jgi:hypothetical protein